eukprot:m.97178 g.97178  ORF g.97178 m.97178 type:complete len:265 (+) comp36935_c0_seq4:16-810(+)
MAEAEDDSAVLSWADPLLLMILEGSSDENFLPFLVPSQDMDPQAEGTNQFELEDMQTDFPNSHFVPTSEERTNPKTKTRSPPREIKRFKCPLQNCPWSFSSEYKLNRHSLTHSISAASKCTCDHCGKDFANKYNLTAHIKEHHQDLQEKPPQYWCPETGCGLIFTEHKLLRQHAKAHGKEVKPPGSPVHVCQFPGCGKRFNRPSKLAAHCRTHTGEKPYVCRMEGCESRFARTDQLKRHQKTHSSLAWLRKHYRQEENSIDKRN